MRHSRKPFCSTALLAVTLSVGISSFRATADDAGTSFKSKPRVDAVAKYSSWMARLPDSVLLSQLSLPGTHDSCALHDGLSLGFAKCQSWSLEDQLKAGVRFIDIRCRHVGDRFLIYHGAIDQRMTFEEVRTACSRFLEKHPTECIVMSVKQESTPKGNSRSFPETFAAITEGDRSLWNINKETPMLGGVRGRIVLVDRVGSLGGLQWGKMKRQDEYKALPERKA